VSKADPPINLWAVETQQRSSDEPRDSDRPWLVENAALQTNRAQLTVCKVSKVKPNGSLTKAGIPNTAMLARSVKRFAGTVRPPERVFRSLERCLVHRHQRSHYHELSFLKAGEPAQVLSYHATDPKDPEPAAFVAPHMVKVEMLAVPWNPADAMSVAGRYPSPTNHTPEADVARSSAFFLHRKVAGSEGWGRVTDVNGDDNNNSVHVGDYVVPGQPGLGTCRSSIWLPTNAVIRLERGQELFDALGATAVAPLFQTGGTAVGMLKRFVALKPGDVVVQNAGNSAVGFMVSQLAASMGLQTVSLVRRGSRSPEQFADMGAFVKQRGKNALVMAEEDVLNSEDSMAAFLSYIRDLSDRYPRLALNAVGGPSAGLLLKLLGPGGTIVTYGGMSMQPVTIPTSQLIFGDIKAAGYWHSRWMAQNSTAAERSKMMNGLVDSVLDDKVECPPVKAFSLSESRAAFEFEAQQSGEAIRSKIVFDCRER
jgi:mitochondrial enoyl-[acyl-carrier protein] reductase / trans-2-enoyl-CoA reductase